MLRIEPIFDENRGHANFVKMNNSHALYFQCSSETELCYACNNTVVKPSSQDFVSCFMHAMFCMQRCRHVQYSSPFYTILRCSMFCYVYPVTPLELYTCEMIAESS